MVKNGNLTLLLTSSGQEWHFSNEKDGKTFIGLLFLFMEMKDLCEARAKLEMSSNLTDEPTLADVPPFETA